MKKTFSKILLDLIPVAIGVYIGLLASDWNESNKLEEKKSQLLAGIETEILTNKSKIDNVDDYHIMLNDSLTIFQNENRELSEQSAPKFWRGLNIPTLQNSAFQTAIQTGITSEMDLDLLQSLNELYANQESYKDFSKTAMAGMYQYDLSDPNSMRSVVTMIKVTMTDLFFKEKELMTNFNTCLEFIKENERH